MVRGVHQTAADLTIRYDNEGLGNIEAKSDVGDTILYGEILGNGGPNAITSIHGLNGYHPHNHQIDYNTFNKISYISDTLENNDVLTLEISYGFDDQRRQTVLSNNGTPFRTKRFFGEYEEIEEGNSVRANNYIYAPTGLCAIFEYDKNNPQMETSTLWHVNTDYLGSIAYMYESGNPSNFKEYSYSAWGIPRNPDDWTQEPTTELFADRGFTGHEHLSEFGLINMLSVTKSRTLKGVGKRKGV